MDVSLPVPAAMEQATVSPRIVRIVLDQFTLLDNFPDLPGCDHPLRPRHLPHRVRQEKQPPCGGASDLLNDPSLSHWYDC